MKSNHHEIQSNTKTHAQINKSETKNQEEKHSWFMLQSAGHSTLPRCREAISVSNLLELVYTV